MIKPGDFVRLVYIRVGWGMNLSMFDKIYEVIEKRPTMPPAYEYMEYLQAVSIEGEKNEWSLPLKDVRKIDE